MSTADDALPGDGSKLLDSAVLAEDAPEEAAPGSQADPDVDWFLKESDGDVDSPGAVPAALTDRLSSRSVRSAAAEARRAAFPAVRRLTVLCRVVGVRETRPPEPVSIGGFGPTDDAPPVQWRVSVLAVEPGVSATSTLLSRPKRTLHTTPTVTGATGGTDTLWPSPEQVVFTPDTDGKTDSPPAQDLLFQVRDCVQVAPPPPLVARARVCVLLGTEADATRTPTPRWCACPGRALAPSQGSLVSVWLTYASWCRTVAWVQWRRIGTPSQTQRTRSQGTWACGLRSCSRALRSEAATW